MRHVRRAISAISNRYRLIQVFLALFLTGVRSAGAREGVMRHAFAANALVTCGGFLHSGYQLSETVVGGA